MLMGMEYVVKKIESLKLFGDGFQFLLTSCEMGFYLIFFFLLFTFLVWVFVLLCKFSLWVWNFLKKD